MKFLSENEHGVRLDLYVQPGAKRNGIVGEHGERLKIAVTQIAEGGKANQAVIELLSDLFGMGKSHFQILHGHTNRNKTLEIAGATLDPIKSILLPLLQTPDR